MQNILRTLLTTVLGVGLWAATAGESQAQFGGFQLQIGGSSFGFGSYGPYGGVYGSGLPFPMMVGPFAGPQYISGYRGYYGSTPSLGGAPGYGYASQTMLDVLQSQQFALQRQQLELQPSQHTLYPHQSYSFDQQNRNGAQSIRGSSNASDLRPGMVLPDGSTVISVDPIPSATPSTASGPQPANVQASSSTSGKSTPRKAAF